MMKISVKEKDKYYNISIKGKNCDIMQRILMLDTLIRDIKEEYGISIKDILILLKDIKGKYVKEVK